MASQKEPKMRAAEADVEFKKSIDELSQAIVEDLKEGYRSDLEPFEAYAERVRGQIYLNLEEFRSRFLQGYQVLLKELKEEHQGREEPPPPGSMKL